MIEVDQALDTFCVVTFISSAWSCYTAEACVVGEKKCKVGGRSSKLILILVARKLPWWRRSTQGKGIWCVGEFITCFTDYARILYLRS